MSTTIASRPDPHGPPVSVLHEDDDLLVVDKPAGLVCHPTKAGEWSSLIGRVRLYLGHDQARFVHRLDRETSGVVVLARSAAVARELGRLFASGDVRKTYLALVHGRFEGTRLIDAPLGRDEASAVAIKDCVRPDGAAARTRVAALGPGSLDGVETTRVEVTPETGRKHQIRIHLASIGHPIVGDKLYGGDEGRYLRLVEGRLTDDDRRALVLTFQALHAWRLGFAWRGREWRFESPPDPALYRA